MRTNCPVVESDQCETDQGRLGKQVCGVVLLLCGRWNSEGQRKKYSPLTVSPAIVISVCVRWGELGVKGKEKKEKNEKIEKWSVLDRDSEMVSGPCLLLAQPSSQATRHAPKANFHIWQLGRTLSLEMNWWHRQAQQTNVRDIHLKKKRKRKKREKKNFLYGWKMNGWMQ